MRILILILGLATTVLCDCWWTGCQLDSWAVKGCEQYGRVEKGTEKCSEGTMFNCCTLNFGDNNNEMPTFSEFSNAATYNGYPAPSEDQYNNFIRHAHRGKIGSKQEAAMALAQFLHESDGLRAKREYACEKNGCPNEYRSPDCDAPGQFYYGRGYIQLSWCRWNYKPASFDIFGDDRLVQDPDQVARDESTAWQVSFWFWGKNVNSKQAVRDGQFGASTKAINGGLECGPGASNSNGAKKRFQIYGNVRRAFGLPGDGDPSGC